MQMIRITNDIALYWSNTAFVHGSDDIDVVAFSAVTVRTHEISVLHSWSTYGQTTVQCGATVRKQASYWCCPQSTCSRVNVTIQHPFVCLPIDRSSNGSQQVSLALSRLMRQHHVDSQWRRLDTDLFQLCTSQHVYWIRLQKSLGETAIPNQDDHTFESTGNTFYTNWFCCQKLWCKFINKVQVFLQCFDTVGWAAGRASGL